MKKVKKKPKSEKESVGSESKLTIPPIKKRVATITIVGESPLLVNKFSEKSKVEMMSKHLKQARGAKEVRDPLQEVRAATYYMSDGKSYGIPASALKNCAVSACRFVEGVKMTMVRGSFFVLEDEDGLVKLSVKGPPSVDERTVQIGPFGKKTKMVRYRPRWDEWSCSFRVLFDPDSISAEQLLNLYERAGFSVGLHEYRPEKSGNCGMFSVKRG